MAEKTAVFLLKTNLLKKLNLNKMNKNFTDLIKNPEYKEAFHMYFHYAGTNKRYANIYKKKMETLEKTFVKQND